MRRGDDSASPSTETKALQQRFCALTAEAELDLGTDEESIEASHVTLEDDELADVPPELREAEKRAREERHLQHEAQLDLAAATATDVSQQEWDSQQEWEEDVQQQDSAGKKEKKLDMQLERLQELLNLSNVYTDGVFEAIQLETDQLDKEEQEGQQAAEKGPAPAVGSKRKAAARPAKAPVGKAPRRGGRATAPEAARAPSQHGFLPLLSSDVTLRDYQIDGVKWLISLYRNGCNGILADEMGLGKTVTTIAFLSYLRSKGVNGPFLVIAPLSVMTNWINEFRKVCPDMPVIQYHGSKDHRDELREEHFHPGRLAKDGRGYEEVPPEFPVVVTTYEMLMSDRQKLQRIQWRYMVIDEGHRLKNYECKLIRELSYLKAESKLLLTGTPLQNNLDELWSLMHFIMPDVFTSLDDFRKLFDFSGADQDATTQHAFVMTKLHRILRPYLLRRMKEDVDLCLPRKQETVLYAPMAPKQRELTDRFLNRAIKGKEGGVGGQNSAALGAAQDDPFEFTANNLLMQLRKVCNHPYLVYKKKWLKENGCVDPPPEQLLEECGKLQLLDRLLRKLHGGAGPGAKGAVAQHKVIVFTQMVNVIDLIGDYLAGIGIDACRLDGRMKVEERAENIKAFQEDPQCWVMLLSTRAGGLGITLTAADTVIIYDSDWNPQVDMQAMDRAHRIGQTRPVHVFRLATAHSVDGRMLRSAAGKKALEALVIKKGEFKDLELGKDKDKKPAQSKTAEVLELLQEQAAARGGGDANAASALAESGVVDDEMLDRLLDRSHLQLLHDNEMARRATEVEAKKLAAAEARRQRQVAVVDKGLAAMAAEEEARKSKGKGKVAKGKEKQAAKQAVGEAATRERGASKQEEEAQAPAAPTAAKERKGRQQQSREKAEAQPAQGGAAGAAAACAGAGPSKARKGRQQHPVKKEAEAPPAADGAAATGAGAGPSHQHSGAAPAQQTQGPQDEEPSFLAEQEQQRRAKVAKEYDEELAQVLPYPPVGVGYQVMMRSKLAAAGLLSSVS